MRAYPPSPSVDNHLVFHREKVAFGRPADPTLSSSSSKYSSHKTGIPIAAFDVSPNGTHAILAGRDILKTIKVTRSGCTEDFNIRSAIIAYASTHDSASGGISATHKDQLAANDVKWSHGGYDTTIATAAANGQIVIYDLNRPGVEYARLHEHVRQVHRVAFNPHTGKENLLLSGSQDATVRLWDLGALPGDRSVMTCRSQHQYLGNNEGIRDLKWSPTTEWEFAVGTDNGVIQRWDIRNRKSPLLKVIAHEKTCHSIDWHPDGKHLVSGGADKYVNVWDFSTTDRRKKPCWQIRAPQAVLNVRWRPPCWNAETTNSGNWQCTQLATSYDNQDPRIHIWDFRRQFVPLREIGRHNTAPTAMLWHSKDLLWSVGSTGIFTQTDINTTSNVSDCRNRNVVSISPNGQIFFFSENKVRKRRFIDDTTNDFLDRDRKLAGSGDKSSGSHSATDGSLEETSLSSSLKGRHRKAHSTRSSKSLASTPPLSSIAPSVGPGEQIQKFDETMEKDTIFHPVQVAASGRINGVFDHMAFKYLGRFYQTPSLLYANNPDQEALRMLYPSFQRNAQLAAYTNQHQLAQSWRIAGLAVEKELRSWSNHEARNLARTTVSFGLNIGSSPLALRNEINRSAHEDESYLPASGIEKVKARLKTPQNLDSSSNMTTPTARPVPDTEADPVITVHEDFSEGVDSLSLPGPAWENLHSPNRSDLTSNILIPQSSRDPVEVIDSESEVYEPAISPRNIHPRPGNVRRSSSRTGFPDLDHHMSERRAAMENYKALPRPLLRLEEPAHTTGIITMPLLDRHDSNESFQLFSASTDSSHRAHSFENSFGSSQESGKSPQSHEQWDNLNRRQAAADCGIQDIVDLSHNVTSTSIKSNTSLPGSLLNASASADQPAKVLRSPPFLRPSNLPPPIIHLEDMEQFQKCATPTTETNMQAEPEYEQSDSLSADPKRNWLPPWSLTSMLVPLVNYHATELSSSQLPAHLLLQLGPLLSSALPPELVISILLTYHAQLVSLSLYPQAARVRKLSQSAYSDISDHGTYGIAPGGPWCTVCKKASKGNKHGYCERCKYRWADCPICDGEGSLPTHASDHYGRTSGKSLEPFDSLWGWCQWCGHGGHAGCLRTWWSNPELSEGGCATAGCLHDCVAGLRRQESLKRKGEAKKIGTVRIDDWAVGESRAVALARGLVEDISPLGVKSQGQPRTKRLGAGQGPLSIGMLGRSSSGGKKVRLLVPQGGREAPMEAKANGEAVSRGSASMP